MERLLFLPITLLLGLTLLIGPVLLANQSVIQFESLIGYDTLTIFTLDMFLGALVMIGAVGVATALWLHEGKMRLSVRQYLVSGLVLLAVGYLTADVLAYNYYYNGVVNFDETTWYQTNLIWYGTGMLTTLIAAGILKRLFIQGDNKMASWGRKRATYTVPSVRASRPLPKALQFDSAA